VENGTAMVPYGWIPVVNDEHVPLCPQMAMKNMFFLMGTMRINHDIFGGTSFSDKPCEWRARMVNLQIVQGLFCMCLAAVKHGARTFL
jgi:hypothetical protein